MNKNIVQQYIHLIGQWGKSLLLIVLLCPVAQGCREESQTIEEMIPISMTASSFDMDLSRAIIDEETDLQKTDLGVYGYKQLANGNRSLVFDNSKLFYTTGKGWEYSPLKFWDRTATTYSFVAYSPYSVENNVKYDMSNHALTITKIPYWQEINENCVDYLVANSSGSADSYLSSDSKSVKLNFTHILSQLVVNIKKDATLNETEYVLTKVDFLHVPVGSGKATYSYIPGNATIGTMSSITISDELNRLNTSTVVATNNDVSLNFLTVPFCLSGKKVQVKVTYTVAGSQRVKTVDTAITELLAGKRYELTLTFKGVEILPTLTVKEWTETTVVEVPKYNW